VVLVQIADPVWTTGLTRMGVLPAAGPRVTVWDEAAYTLEARKISILR